METLYSSIIRKKLGNTLIGESGAIVVQILFADVISLLLFLIASIIFSSHAIFPNRSVVIITLFGAVALIVGLMLFGKTISGILVNLTSGRNHFLIRKLIELHNRLQSVGTIRVIAKTLLCTLVMGSINWYVSYLLLHLWCPALSYWDVIIASSITQFAIIIPLQPIGGWGVFEGAMVAGLALVGIHPSTALQVSVALHAIGYVYIVPISIAGFLLLRPQTVHKKNQTVHPLVKTGNV